MRPDKKNMQAVFLCARLSVTLHLIINIVPYERDKNKGQDLQGVNPQAEILQKVKAVADRINKDMAGKNPLLLAMLNGSFVFAADLMRTINVPCEISFVRRAIDEGTASTGKVSS